MFGRRSRAEREDAARAAEADRLYDEADRIGGGREAGVPEWLPEPPPAPAAAAGPGADLNAEIDRLAAAFPERGEPAAVPDAITEERDRQYARVGRQIQHGGYGGRTPQAAGLTTDPAVTWADIASDRDAPARADEDTGRLRAQAERENWPPWEWPGRNETPAERAAELGISEADYLAAELAERGGKTAPWAQEPVEIPSPEPGDDAAAWSAGFEADELQALPDGTPHADPFLAGRGWQAQDGLYVRQPQTQLEAG